jgi:cell division protein FtsA
LTLDPIVGLDLGSSRVRAVVANIGPSGIVEVIGVGDADSAGIVEGSVIDIAKASGAIGIALKKASQSSGVTIRRVVLGISGKHIASLNTRGAVPITRTTRRVTLDDLIRCREQAKIIVLPPEREILHCIPRFYRVDGQNRTSAPMGLHATRLEMEAHIVTGSVAVTQSAAEAVRTAGYSLQAAVFSGLASAESYLLDEDRLYGAVSANIGSGTTEITIYKEGCIVHSSVVPRGGSHISHDISARWQIPYDEAESIKVTYGAWPKSGTQDSGRTTIPCSRLGSDEGQAVCREHVLQIVRCRMDELFYLIRQEVIKSGYYNLLQSGVVLSGGCAGLHGLLDECGQAVNMPARIGRLIPSVCEPANVRMSAYGTAIGLVKYFSTSSERHLIHRTKPRTSIASAVGQFMARYSSRY